MEAYWIWWLVAVALVIAEMSSGTFYLIAIAFGLAAAGMVAYLGMGWSGQVMVAAALCSTSVALIHHWNKQRCHPRVNSNFANDIGQSVRIVSWSDENHARVSYRGAEWDAELAGHALLDTARQTWRITAITGSRLIIE